MFWRPRLCFFDTGCEEAIRRLLPDNEAEDSHTLTETPEPFMVLLLLGIAFLIMAACTVLMLTRGNHYGDIFVLFYLSIGLCLLITDHYIPKRDCLPLRGCLWSACRFMYGVFSLSFWFPIVMLTIHYLRYGRAIT